MKEHEFHNDQKLKALYFADNERVFASADTTITVIMESGQMASVPWAIVEGNGAIHKWNLALVLGVELAEEPTL